MLFDDRLGVYIIMEAMKRAKERGCKAGVYGASTTGEETNEDRGLTGQEHGSNPTMAIVVDVTYASDYNGMDPAETELFFWEKVRFCVTVLL